MSPTPIAHDLRTPIARARAKLEDALATSEDEESLRATVEQGIADLDGISRIFQALLRIAEAEAGARRAAFAPLDLAHVLADAAEIYEATAESRGQRLETDLPERLALVGDRDLVAAGGGEPAGQRHQVHPRWRHGAAFRRGDGGRHRGDGGG